MLVVSLNGSLLATNHLQRSNAAFWVLGSGNGLVMEADNRTVRYGQLNLVDPIKRDNQAVPNALIGDAMAAEDMDAMGASLAGRRLLSRHAFRDIKAMDDMLAMQDMPGMDHGSSAVTQAPLPEPAGNMSGMAHGAARAVPKDYGYTVVRMVADNPGVWALHCHISPHSETGMFMHLRVASDNASQPWPAPPADLGCGALMPSQLVDSNSNNSAQAIAHNSAFIAGHMQIWALVAAAAASVVHTLFV